MVTVLSEEHDSPSIQLYSDFSGVFIEVSSEVYDEALVWTEEAIFSQEITGYQETKTNGQYTAIQQDEIAFAQLVGQWHRERGITSSLSEMIVCPSYLRIIAMGEKALPLILAQLRREGDDPDHWSAALEAITGEDPIPKEVYGDTVKIAKAWLSWAEERNVW